MKRKIAFILLIGMLLLPGIASAANYDELYSTSGKAATSNDTVTYFYVTVNSPGASITLHQNNKGLMHWKWDYLTYDEVDREAYATYIVNIKKDDGNKYSWEYDRDHTGWFNSHPYIGNDWIDQDFKITFESSGTYIVRVTSIENNADTKYARAWNTLLNLWDPDYWVNAPTWSISDKSGCQVSANNPRKSGNVYIYYYTDGNYYGEEMITLDKSDYISPKSISGYTCTSGREYVSLDTSTGTCSPSTIYFYYTKNGPTSGTVTIYYYTDGNYYDSQTMTISSSQYIYPKTLSGYTCTSSNQYVTFDSSTGKCSPDVVQFNYKKDTPATVPPVQEPNYYIIESSSPNGYCYLYDQPSDVYGKNLGRHENGELVEVLAYNSSNGGYYQVRCSNGKVGYIHEYALRPYGQNSYATYMVYSTSPMGYCYLYDQPNDVTGKNLGRYNNGEYIEIIDWNASTVYAKVRCISTGKVGYIRKTCMVEIY